MANTVNLYFKVSKQAIKRTDEEFVASGAINTHVANFDFCETWEGLYKFCRFEGAGSVVDVRIEDDKCVIPWEVLEFPGFTMACYGTLSTDVMLTTAKLNVKVFQSVNFITDEPLPPTPQLVEYYNNMANNDLSDLATQTQISEEAQARQAAINAAVSAEAQARSEADTALTASINAAMLPKSNIAVLTGTAAASDLYTDADGYRIKYSFPDGFNSQNCVPIFFGCGWAFYNLRSGIEFLDRTMFMWQRCVIDSTGVFHTVQIQNSTKAGTASDSEIRSYLKSKIVLMKIS